MELKISQVQKSYQQLKVLQDINLTLTPGVYGLLGPNGAGKSTLINIITDNIQPDDGMVLFNQQPIAKLGRKYRNSLGYMPQQQGLYEDFTGSRFLWYMAALKNLSKKEATLKIKQLSETVNLSAYMDRKIGSYSGGMKQRLLIAQALLNDPAIVILDEPTAGLDPKERISIRNFISTIADQKIVLIATHVVSDIEYIAKEIIVMKKGSIILHDEPAELLLPLKESVAEVRIHESELHEIKETYLVSNIVREKDNILSVRIISYNLDSSMQHLVKPNLEDLYLYHFHGT